MDKWTDTKRRNFKRFWESDMGKESMQLLEDLKEQKMEQALRESEKGESYIAQRIHEASGIDYAIQTIISLK